MGIPVSHFPRRNPTGIRVDMMQFRYGSGNCHAGMGIGTLRCAVVVMRTWIRHKLCCELCHGRPQASARQLNCPRPGKVGKCFRALVMTLTVKHSESNYLCTILKTFVGQDRLWTALRDRSHNLPTLGIILLIQTVILRV